MAALVAVALPTMAQGVGEPNGSGMKVKYSVSGTYAKDGKTVYLVDKLTEKNIDSTKVADGKFAFNGSADKDALMAVAAAVGRPCSSTTARP